MDRCEPRLDFVGLGHLLGTNDLIEHVYVVCLFRLSRFELVIIILDLDWRLFKVLDR